MLIRFEVPMLAPREALFRVLCDPLLRTRWQRSLERVERSQAGLAELGTRWNEVTKLGPRFEMEIIRHEPPRRWAERGRGPFVQAELDVTLEPAREGTRLTLALELQLSPVLRPLQLFLKPVIARELKRDLGRLDALACARRVSHAPHA